MSKSVLKSFRVVLCKKPLQKTLNIREMKPFRKSAIMQRLQPMQNPHFGSKIEISKNMSKSILQIIQSSSVQKTAQEYTKYLRNETILKISNHAKAIQPMQNPHFASKIKIPKNMSKSILQIIQSCFVPRSAPKNIKYSRNETISKIGHHAKAIAHAKSSLWLKN